MKQPQNQSLSTDYPAAHSMDTTWFALDKDGQIAAFESYEGGAVPNDALSDQNADIDPLTAIASHTTKCGMIYALEDRRSPINQDFQHAPPQKPYKRPAPLTAHSFWQNIASAFNFTSKPAQIPPAESNPDSEAEKLIAPVMMLLPDLQIVAAELANGTCQQVNGLNGKLVLFMDLPIDLYRSIHDRGQCDGCYYMYDLPAAEDPLQPIYSQSGLYHYVCCESQMAVPYGRLTIPERPLEVDELPSELQDRLAKVHFADLSFSKTPYIQPAERMPSYTWDGGFLREDWKTFQANPGQEKEYEELYKSIAEYGNLDGFNYQPPSG
jgi:hypothetical protein